jgi:predicted phosphodiesterase
MTRIALLADIHGNLPALQAVVADLATHNVSQILNLGDHASGPLWPRDTVAFLMAQPWLQIAGNHERQLVTQDPASHGASDRYAWAELTAVQKEWLAVLPTTMPGPEGILLCHGTPTSDSHYLLESVERGVARLAAPAEITQRLGHQTAPVVACGHSHTPRLVTAADGTLLINPGSVGLPAYEHDEPELHLMQTGSPHARYAVLESSSGGWLATFRLVSYDHASAAAQAERNGRPEWARALMTGYV